MIMAAMYPDKIRKMVVWGANAYVTPEECKLYDSIKNVDSWSERMRQPFEALYGKEYFREQWAQWVENFSKYALNPEG